MSLFKVGNLEDGAKSMDAMVGYAGTIAEADWADRPRVSTGLATRSIRRAMMAIPAEHAGLRAFSGRLLPLAHAFASGSHLVPGDTADAARVLSEEAAALGGALLSLESAHPAFPAVFQAMSSLASGMVHAVGSIVLMEYYPYERRWADELSQTAFLARKAREEADGSLPEILEGMRAMGLGARSDSLEVDGQRIRSALEADGRALEGYKRREIDRLGDVEVDSDAFDPAMDPSEGGPLGLLWPQGAPSWCRDEEQAAPRIVSLHQFKDQRDARAAPDIVVHGLLYGAAHMDAGLLLEDGRRFVEHVMSSGKSPPVPCVYLPDSMPHNERVRMLSEFVAAGAIVFGDRELDWPGILKSDDDFATAVAVLDRRTDDRWQQACPLLATASATVALASAAVRSGLAPIAGGDWEEAEAESDPSPLVDEEHEPEGWPIAG